jgi:hypothetical protein
MELASRSGKRPFDRASVDELSRAVMGGYVRPSREAQGLGPVERVLERGLAASREQRYPSMDDLLEALARRDASFVSAAALRSWQSPALPSPSARGSTGGARRQPRPAS